MITDPPSGSVIARIVLAPIQDGLQGQLTVFQSIEIIDNLLIVLFLTAG